eukprot:11827690-Alexandrium_andersonii.AAC.1
MGQAPLIQNLPTVHQLILLNLWHKGSSLDPQDTATLLVPISRSQRTPRTHIVRSTRHKQRLRDH